MGSIIGKMRYLALIAVVGSLLASIVAFIYGFVKTVNIILKLLTSAFNDEAANISFIELMDTFLIATALLIFALGMYELFIGDLNLPEWLVIHDFNGLKVKLSGVIILVLAVTFLKHLVDWEEPEKTLLLGTATALVAGVLILFNRSENSKE
jgi:uncharacterized protein (TIGR00645 family)